MQLPRPRVAALKSLALVLCLSLVPVLAAWDATCCSLLLPEANSHPRLESLVSDFDTPFPPTSQSQMASFHFSVELSVDRAELLEDQRILLPARGFVFLSFSESRWFEWAIFGDLK